MKKVLVVFGTRPEAIKMAPVVQALQDRPESFDVKVLSTGQHREMLWPVLNLFGMTPDIDLDVMSSCVGLNQITAEILRRLEHVFESWRPDWVLVHGDTTTAFATGLACFYAGIQCAHVEAGLRTGDFQRPWPEEMNRVLLAPMMKTHFSPTDHARRNLLREGIGEDVIHVTGNTVIDALYRMVDKLDEDEDLRYSFDRKFSFLDNNRRMILVTGHRRENFGSAMESLCEAMRNLSERPDVQLVYAVHLNPNVRETVTRVLGGTDAVLIEPQDYLPFIYLMNRSDFLITDSGGVQEEAPSLGKPVLVTRDRTERIEAVEAGTVKLVGTDGEKLYDAASMLLNDRDEYDRMSQISNPYGDGKASGRIASWLSHVH